MIFLRLSLSISIRSRCQMVTCVLFSGTLISGPPKINRESFDSHIFLISLFSSIELFQLSDITRLLMMS